MLHDWRITGNLVFQGHTKSLYVLAFLKGDTAKMAQLAAFAMGKPETEDGMLSAESDTEVIGIHIHSTLVPNSQVNSRMADRTPAKTKMDTIYNSKSPRKPFLAEGASKPKGRRMSDFSRS